MKAQKLKKKGRLATRNAKTLEKYHKKNNKILRMREFNRQMKIKPFQGLKEILAKKEDLNLSDCESVNEENYKDYREPSTNQHITKEVLKYVQLRNSIIENEEKLNRKNRSKSADEPKSKVLPNNEIMKSLRLTMRQRLDEEAEQDMENGVIDSMHARSKSSDLKKSRTQMRLSSGGRQQFFKSGLNRLHQENQEQKSSFKFQN